MPDAPSSEDPLPERLQRKGRFQQTLNPAFSMKMRGDGPNRAARFVRDNQMDLARRDNGGGQGFRPRAMKCAFLAIQLCIQWLH